MHRRCRACRRPARWRYPLVASVDSDANPRPDRRVKVCRQDTGVPTFPAPSRWSGPPITRKAFEVDQPPLNALLQSALASGDDRELRTALAAGSGLPGPRLNLRLVDELAGAVGDVVRRADPPVERLAGLLDGWARLSVDEAPGDRPEVILPCAAVAAYGEVAAARPDWWDDEMAKLRRAARDRRPRPAVGGEGEPQQGAAPALAPGGRVPPPARRLTGCPQRDGLSCATTTVPDRDGPEPRCRGHRPTGPDGRPRHRDDRSPRRDGVGHGRRRDAHGRVEPRVLCVPLDRQAARAGGRRPVR